MYDTILVATHGSEHAEHAVDHALDLAKGHGADVHALFVVDTRTCDDPALGTGELVLTAVEETGASYLAALARRARENDVPLTTRICRGVPEREIVEYADGIDADVVVLGGADPGEVGHLGRVGERVVETGRWPVLTA